MSEANSAMTLHSLVLSSDSFSCNCNSIQSPVSIVHLRVILTYLIPLLRVYINQHSSNAIQFNFVQQCIQISTRINSSSVHTYIFVCFIRNSLRVILQGFVDPIMQQIQVPTLCVHASGNLVFCSVIISPDPNHMRFAYETGPVEKPWPKLR